MARDWRHFFRGERRTCDTGSYRTPPRGTGGEKARVVRPLASNMASEVDSGLFLQGTPAAPPWSALQKKEGVIRGQKPDNQEIAVRVASLASFN